MKRHTLWAVLVLACLSSASLLAQEAVPAARRNAELERRLRAALAKSSGVWGVSIKHVERQELAGINEDEKFQMASVFKIPVLVELFHQVRAGKVALDERIEWTDPQLYFGSGILVALDPGLRPTVRDLATLMIIVSDNAATDILCHRLGFANITARLRTLHLAKTSVEAGTRELILQALGLRGEAYQKLTRESLRDVDWSKIADEVERNRQRFLEECPNCTTPAEMTALLEQLVRGQAADADATEQMLRILSRQQFNQRLPRWLPYGVRSDHKTGTLTTPVWVVNDAGIIYLPTGERVIVSVFSRGTQTSLTEADNKIAVTNAEDRIAELAKLVFDFYTVSPPAP